MSDKKLQVTRIRIEVSGPERNEVQDMLIESARFNRECEGGEWEVEDPGVEVQGTKDGYWGRVTIRRKSDAQSDPVPAR